MADPHPIRKIRTPRAKARTLLYLGALLTALPGLAIEPADPLQPTGRWTLADFGDAPRPPMGWNSWNAFHTQIDEAKLIGSAQAIVDLGLRDLGYRYINIDDGWWQKRRESDGRLEIRTSIFPSAKTGGAEETSFRPIVDRLHALKLKAGIYTDLGRNSCSQAYPEPDSLLPTGSVAEREVGAYGHVDQDMTLYFKDWGFDYIKVDGCGLNAFSADKAPVRAGQFRELGPLVVSDAINLTQVDVIRRLYAQVRDAIQRVRPNGDFVFSICNWGTANVRAWGREIGNLWRTSDDIEPRWTSLLRNFDTVVTRELYSGPGHWNDPDMLFIGHGDFDAQHLTEARTHFALWAITDAPLIIGFDLRQAPKSLVDIWSAREIVAVNQDPAGNQGVIAYDSDDLQILVKQLSNRDEKAVVLFNRGSGPAKAVLTAAHLKFKAADPIQVRDLWAQRDLAPFTNELSLTLAPRESRMLRVRGSAQIADGLYLSEMPGRIHVAADGIRDLQADPVMHRPVDINGSRGTGTRPVLAGWGGPRADSTPYGNELRIKGAPFTSGLGVLGNSRLEVRTERGFKRFSAQVGIDDSTLERGTKVRFEVYGDGRLLAQSPSLGFGEAPITLAAPVAGVVTVELVARELGAGHAPVVATWAEAALTR